MSRRAFLHVARADFLERVRRRSFLVVAGLGVWGCYLMVPPATSGWTSLDFGGVRGGHNAAWMGLLFALVTVLVLPLPAFLLVRGSLERDRETRVGPILAATRLRSAVYLLGKAASNLLVLAAVLGIVSLMAVVMLVLRRESGSLDLVTLLAPVWLLGLPVMVVLSGLAVLFESVRWLRAGLGNVVFFFGWLTALSLSMVHLIDRDTGRMRPANDLLGMSRSIAAAQAWVEAREPGGHRSFTFSLASQRGDQPQRVIPWEAESIDGRRVGERLSWCLLGLTCGLLAAVPFDRFDPARGRGRRTRGSGRGEPLAEPVAPAGGPVSLTPLTDAAGTSRWWALLRAELKLLGRGQSRWWWLGAAGLLIAQVVVPWPAVRDDLLPWVWLWPVLALSPLGSRDAIAGTEALVDSAPRSGTRRTLTGWGAGALFLVLLTGPLLLRLLAAGRWTALVAVGAGTLFAPALAMALGAWTRVRRAFEAVYLLWWYLAFNDVGAADFLGRWPEGPRILAYLALTAVLVAIALAKRRGPRRRAPGPPSWG